MPRRLLGAALAVLLLVSCDSSADTDGDGTVPGPATVVPLFYFDGEALLAEYSELPRAREPVAAIVRLLAAGPRRGDLTSALSHLVETESVEEAGETYFIEFNDAFWDATAADRRRSAAQIVQSLAALEAGKEVTLLDDGVPGPIPSRDAETLEHPLSVDDFFDLRPWILVEQPAAGSLVANPLPASAIVRSTAPVIVSVRAGGVAVGAGKLGPPVSWDAPPGEAIVRFDGDFDGEHHRVDVPVVLSRAPTL